MNEGEEDNAESNVQVQEETDEGTEASALAMEEDSEKDEGATVSFTTNQTFSSKYGMHWRPKHLFVMKRKGCNIVSTNLVLQNDVKKILSISEAFPLFTSKKMVKEICSQSSKKTKAVFGSSSRKQKTDRIIHPKDYVCL